MTVIVPFYNEDPSILKEAVRSILDAEGNKEIIVVDDGSEDKECAQMICKEFDTVRLIRYNKNRGKRFAQLVAMKHAKGKFILTVDSDTVVDIKALVNLVKPFDEPEVGATTGNVKVLNEKQNTLTRMIASRYWNAFNIERKSLSGQGIVTCCSGVLSAYRATLLRKLMPLYVGQKFLGAECTYGDDRHLTNLTLERDFKIRYVQDSVCYTAAPTHIGGFIRQQLRWKKSFIRESLITLKFAWRRSKLLFLEVSYNLSLPFLSLGVRIGVILSLILYPSYVPVFLLSVCTVAIIRNFFLFLENRQLALYTIPYAFVHEFILYWLYFVAVFTLKNKSWGTR
ncbi:glycosyltransferase [Candidatus Woesearchaeota archaeon]|nr:glycosyltransferase [Candidatus Woesearchaeota archaeon]